MFGNDYEIERPIRVFGNQVLYAIDGNIIKHTEISNRKEKKTKHSREREIISA